MILPTVRAESSRRCGHTRADPGDHTGTLHPEDVAGAGRRRIEPLPLQEIRPVHAGDGDVDEDLAGPRTRQIRRLSPPHHVWFTETLEGHRTHAVIVDLPAPDARRCS